MTFKTWLLLSYRGSKRVKLYTTPEGSANQKFWFSWPSTKPKTQICRSTRRCVLCTHYYAPFLERKCRESFKLQRYLYGFTLNVRSSEKKHLFFRIMLAIQHLQQFEIDHRVIVILESIHLCADWSVTVYPLYNCRWSSIIFVVFTRTEVDLLWRVGFECFSQGFIIWK